MAGAKAYAAKLHISPMTTVHTNLSVAALHLVEGVDSGSGQSVYLTCADAGPPQGVPKINEAIPFKAMSFFCLIKTLAKQGQHLIDHCDIKMTLMPRVVVCVRLEGRANVGTFFVMTKLVPGQSTNVSQRRRHEVSRAKEEHTNG